MATTATANPSFVPQSPSHWVPDEKRSSCKSCHKDFTLFNRRHHCRSCREVFCGDCSDYRLLTRDPKDASVVTSVRACRKCFDTFRGRKARGPKSKSGSLAPAAAKPRRNSKAEAEQPDAQHKPLEVEMPEQHFEYEGEDPAITGHETIRVEEDDDHYVYPDDGHHHEQAGGHTVQLLQVLGPDGKQVNVGRDTVMAAQGSVVLPSSQAQGGLQFVNVDQTHSTTTSTTAATTQSANPTLPKDSPAVFEESHLTARTPANAASSQSVDKSAKSATAAAGGEKDEFDRRDGAVEGSEEILHIPSDALASVKNSALMARHQQAADKEEEGDVAWSERNVESQYKPSSGVSGVKQMFKEGEEQA